MNTHPEDSKNMPHLHASSPSTDLPGGVGFHILQEIHLRQGLEALLQGGMPGMPQAWKHHETVEPVAAGDFLVGHGEDNARRNHCMYVPLA